MGVWQFGPMTSNNRDGFHQEGTLREEPEAAVTRKEYEELFLSITRLTDRIEALEAGLSRLDLYQAGVLKEIDLKSVVLWREPME